MTHAKELHEGLGPGAAGTGGACPDCGGGLDHCHETLIEHDTGWLECPDPGCAADPLRHAWAVPCRELTGEHGCPDCREEAVGVPEIEPVAA